jgi:uncharacterized protein
VREKAHLKSLKTFNDPIYGFITIEDELIFEILEHPYFQRLRRISQLGLTNLVYSGANHSRFQHALGAMNLMKSALQVLRSKGFEVSPEDEQAAKIAILLHDIGHGPYSHALEKTIVSGTHHERIGLLVMEQLNEEFNGRLDRAIAIYTGLHPVNFLHQLVSSQLDTDRLDYLKRDSFFTGVSEGVIGSERLIKMMTLHEGELVVEAKGIYSLEKFLLARRLMYWQVYLHKTVVSAEFLLMNILLRAKELIQAGSDLYATPPLSYFLKRSKGMSDLTDNESLKNFLELDDFDVMSCIKAWCNSDDKILSMMCSRLVSRKLLKTKQLNALYSQAEMEELRSKYSKNTGLSISEVRYIIFQNSVSNTAYTKDNEGIKVLQKNGDAIDLSQAGSLFNFASMESMETKHYLYFPSDFKIH